MIRLQDLLFNRLTANKKLNESVLNEQPATEQPATKQQEKPKVLFVGDQQTAGRGGYAYRLIKSKLVIGNIAGLTNISAGGLYKLLRRKLKPAYNVVIVQVTPDMAKISTLKDDIRDINKCINIASSYGAVVITIITPSVKRGVIKSDAITIYNEIISEISGNVIETMPHTSDITKLNIINTNLQKSLQYKVINNLNQIFDIDLTADPIASSELDADNPALQNIKNIPDLGPAPANAAAFISLWKDTAIDQMNRYGIPASITLAQGGLESGWGRSGLAKKANNLFGIKCHSSWSGEKIYASDDHPNECFRKYPDAIQSFNDHSLFLKNNRRYADLFKLDKTDYEGWAKGLQSAGYATGDSYAKKLISIIKSYGLDAYDTGGDSSKTKDKLNSLNNPIPDLENSKLSFSSRAKSDYDAGIINPNLIKDIIQALEIAGVTARIGTAKTGHARNVKNSSKESRHMSGTGVDLDMFNGQGNSGGNGKNKGLGGSGGASFMSNGDKVIDALKTLGYRYGESGNSKGYIWRSDTGGNHWNHIHVSNTNK